MPGLALVRRARPDVVLVDLSPAGAGALPALRGLAAASHPCPRVGVLAEAADPWTVASARSAGVAGLVAKDDLADPGALVALVRALARGARVTSPRIAALEAHAGLRAGLTPREAELVACFVQGLGTEEAAARLCVVPQRVRNMTSAVGRKLGVSGRAAIVAKVLREERVAVPAAA